MNRSPQKVRQLVISLNSYPLAAKVLHISKQRVHQLAGPGLTTRNPTIECIDCGAKHQTSKTQPSVRCERCNNFFKRHGIPYSPKAAKRVQAEGRVKQAIAQTATHCYLGHPLSGDNLYTSPDGRRFCRICKKLRVARYKTDPEFQQKQRDAVNRYQSKNREVLRERQRHRYATDEAYRERMRQHDRKRRERERAAKSDK